MIDNGRERKERRNCTIGRTCPYMISCFANDTELGISEIAERMDLSKSTTYGLVNTLTAFGYLEQTENKNTAWVSSFLSWEILFSPAWMSAWRRGPIASRWRTNTELRSTWLPILRERSSTLTKWITTARLLSTHRLGSGPYVLHGRRQSDFGFSARGVYGKYVLSRPLIKMTEHTITTGDGC